MREIKFRVWLKKYKSMETGLFGLRSDGMISFNSEGILMQYTGLKDKNGKEIYEGDVVLHFGGGRWRVITYKHCGFISMRGELEIEIPKRSEDVEVIGNIHENPELVKEKTNAVNP